MACRTCASSSRTYLPCSVISGLASLRKASTAVDTLSALTEAGSLILPASMFAGYAFAEDHAVDGLAAAMAR